MTNGFVTSGPLIRVQGAGIAEVNGYYRRQDNEFTKEGTYEGEKVTFSICRTGTKKYWTLFSWQCKTGPCLYHCKNGEESVPAESGWETVKPHVGPAPILTIIT